MTNRFLFLILLLSAAISSPAQDITGDQADSMRNTLKTTTSATNRINLLLTLAQYQVFKPGEFKTDLDSAEAYIDEAAPIAKSMNSPTVDGYLILTKSYLTDERGHREKAKRLADQAVGMLESGNNKSYLGKAYLQLGHYYRFSVPAEVDKKIPLVEKAIRAFQQGGNIEMEAFSLTLLGDLYNVLDDIPQALKALNSAIAAYDSIHYKRLQKVYTILGTLSRKQKNYGEALQYELKALKIAAAVQDSTMHLCEIHNQLGVLYRELDLIDLSIAHFKTALQTAVKYDDRYSVHLLMFNIAEAYDRVRQPQQSLDFLTSIPEKYQHAETEIERVYVNIAYGQTYTKLNQPKKAAPFVETLTELANSHTLSGFDKSNIHRALARYFFITGQYSKARLYQSRNKAFYNRFSAPFAFAMDLPQWYELDSVRGDFKSAFNTLLLYKTMTDSLQDITKQRQLQQMEVQYETAKKEDSLKLKDEAIQLLTQKNTLQQSNLDQALIIRNGTIAGIVLTLAIIGLLYRQYRLKQLSNITISTKNEQLQHLVGEKDWLVKEIHHRVKNNFQTVMGLLGTQCAYLNSEEAKIAIRDSQQRIQAMSLIHQRLYQTENLSGILMSDYIHELVDYLCESYTIANRIRFKLEIDPIEMDLAHSIPIGLILNEAISNSFKYAFPDNQQGIIGVSLRHTSENNILLTIGDNGIGLPPAFNSSRANSMGMNLMKGLCMEMDAEFLLSGKEGTRVDLSFAYAPVQSGPFKTLLADTQLKHL